jgi:hypothetical protein
MYPAENARLEMDKQDTKHLWAIGILDTWGQRNDGVTQPVPVFHKYIPPFGRWLIIVFLPDGRVYAKLFETAREARVEAAKGLVAEDPTLGGD